MPSLRTLYVELRLEIYELCLVVQPVSEPYHAVIFHENTPALLVALRGERDLYEEALGVYYKINTFYYYETATYQSNGYSGINTPNAFRHLRNFGINAPTDSTSPFFKDNLTHLLYFMCEASASGIHTFGSQVIRNLETININLSCEALSNIIPLLRLLRPYLAKLKRLSINISGELDSSHPVFVEISRMFGLQPSMTALKFKEEVNNKDNNWRGMTAVYSAEEKTVSQFVWRVREGQVLKKK
ncbi:hypothetical protein HYFRA_00012027 [Hymenoscyphus fraxineus]|uniref:Uncharacterized protein n=1 Tax=Hymenoscyphus fraxineus TaxID=746836 RepID=A0A9N9PRJ0_9HELO|nr:hypothetical protein HYFRA_00012027 [Hymenoscyphus fraxineus]